MWKKYENSQNQSGTTLSQRVNKNGRQWIKLLDNNCHKRLLEPQGCRKDTTIM